VEVDLVVYKCLVGKVIIAKIVHDDLYTFDQKGIRWAAKLQVFLWHDGRWIGDMPSHTADAFTLQHPTTR
jgi:hypothetical protein